MKTIYLVAAIVGALLPMYFFAQYFGSGGGGLAEFISALFVNGATSGFASDLLISSVVFWIFMWVRRASGPAPWLFIALNLMIGLSCALPAYLYMCERQKATSGS